MNGVFCELLRPGPVCCGDSCPDGGNGCWVEANDGPCGATFCSENFLVFGLTTGASGGAEEGGGPGGTVEKGGGGRDIGGGGLDCDKDRLLLAILLAILLLP